MSDSKSKCVLAIDVGSSGPKISVIDANGDILATKSGHFDSIYSDEGRGVEQDPNEMWEQILRLCKVVVDESGMAKKIVAIGNCSQYFSSIPVDKDGNATYNMIMWEDSRASKHVTKLMGGFPQYLGYNIFKLARWLISVGIPPINQGIGATCHMVWLQKEKPEVWEKTYKVLEPSDYVSLKLTGKFATNENLGFSYSMIKKAGWSKGSYNENLINALNLDSDKYPEILPVCDNLGTPKQEIVDYLGLSDDVTVFGGMQDTTACMLGGGAFDDYDAVIEIGTTLNTGVVVPERIIDVISGFYSVSSPVKGKFIMVGEPGAGAKSLNYLLKNFLRVDDPLSKINESNEHHAAIADQMASESPMGCNGLFFLPWIFGATFPEADAKMRGGFINLSPENTRNDMIRSIFESYAVNFKWVLEAKTKGLKGKIRKVNFTGGGAMWETAPQIVADALQLPVHLMDEPRQAPTKGIAAVCFNNLGIVSFEELKKKLKVKKVFEPNPQNFAHYDKQLGIFKLLYKKMRPIYASINH